MALPIDPLNFIPADTFYSAVPNFQKSTTVVSVESSDTTKAGDVLRYAAHVTLKAVTDTDHATHVLIQFVTPEVWRIRYNPKFQDVNQYPDANSRTIVMNKFSDLVDGLQKECQESMAWNARVASSSWHWKTTFEQLSDTHWVLTSMEYESSGAQGKPATKLHVFAQPFRIVATRVLAPKSSSTAFQQTQQDVGVNAVLASEQIIWQTTDETFVHQDDPNIGVINNVVLNVSKPAPAQYLGFGEQGGRTVLKRPTYMNFFCYDNFNYTKVYGQGPLNPREPLYHSTPFYLEMNGTPEYRNVTGLLVDNYSQVAIDLGKGNSSVVSVGTRFGTFDAYVMTADDVPRMIWQYTSLVGRPKLKPRFILGHHQGCYGYTCNNDVNSVVSGYRAAHIPLDGMHLDVDFQDRYRTFTVNGINWPNVKGFLQGLRKQGVKSCTNITPILSLREFEDDPYLSLEAFWDQNDKLNPKTNLLVNDHRYTEGLPAEFPVNGCTRFDGGYATPSYKNPDYLGDRITFADYIGAEPYTDNYVFMESDPDKQQGNYNSGYPFHGGVSYGQNLGTVGYYPDLNRKDAREKWGQQYQFLFDNGLEFVWQDMTTPAAGYCYGDMLGFPSRLLMTDDTYDQKPGEPLKTKTAIELWALYSYNLHKATYHGLNRLKGRENKRNFIIGRGSQTGMHRYAGLWTGDNGSSWDFWRISVAQVLALGYSGLTIAGVDMGGFTQDPGTSLPPPRWCDPELLIRWYSGAFLLPWYRNHYIQHFESKAFQEPFRYTAAVLDAQYGDLIPASQRGLYLAVEPICRYFVQLRYSLMQVLYDAMFANLVHGLPIARAMLITDPDDTTLFSSSAHSDFVDTQYLLGHNILVCPVTNPGVFDQDVYLPGTDLWFPSNLRVNDQNFGPDPLGIKHAAQLLVPVAGGTTISYGCGIPQIVGNVAGPAQIPYVTPVYIRAGAIIPQLDVRQSIEENDLNPPTIHIYPGNPAPGNQRTSYSMYLDDGVSRDSAPGHLPQYYNCHHVAEYVMVSQQQQDSSSSSSPQPPHDHDTKDSEAKSKYREVKFVQDYTTTTRTIQISHPWDNFDATPTVGGTYQLAIWTVQQSPQQITASSVSVAFKDQDGNKIDDNGGLTYNYDANRAVLIVNVPVAVVPTLSREWAGGPPSDDVYIAVEVTGLN